MNFTLRQIEVFVEAAKDGNFRRTAERLDISQPSVSRHIQLLERDAGGRLFERGRGSSARLSALGEELLKDAQKLLAAAGKVTIDRRPRLGPDYVLRIAVGTYLHDVWLRPLVRELCAMDGAPSVQLIQLEDQEEIVASLLREEAEIGFYTGNRADDRNLVSEEVSIASLGMFGRPSLLNKLGADLRDISSAPMIMPLAGSRAAQFQLAALAKSGIYPANVVSRSQFPQVILDQTLKGLGLSIMFEGQVAEQVAAGNLKRLPFEFDSGHRCVAMPATIARELSKKPEIAFLLRSFKSFSA